MAQEREVDPAWRLRAADWLALTQYSVYTNPAQPSITSLAMSAARLAMRHAGMASSAALVTWQPLSPRSVREEIVLEAGMLAVIRSLLSHNLERHMFNVQHNML